MTLRTGPNLVPSVPCRMSRAGVACSQLQAVQTVETPVEKEKTVETPVNKEKNAADQTAWRATQPGGRVVDAVRAFVSEAGMLRAKGYHFSLQKQQAARVRARTRGSHDADVADEVRSQEEHRNWENDFIFGDSPDVPSRERRATNKEERSERERHHAAGVAEGGGEGAAERQDLKVIRQEVQALKEHVSQEHHETDLHAINRRIGRELARVSGQNSKRKALSFSSAQNALGAFEAS